jgi:ribosomal protein L13E
MIPPARSYAIPAQTPRDADTIPMRYQATLRVDAPSDTKPTAAAKKEDDSDDDDDNDDRDDDSDDDDDDDTEDDDDDDDDDDDEADDDDDGDDGDDGAASLHNPFEPAWMLTSSEGVDARVMEEDLEAEDSRRMEQIEAQGRLQGRLHIQQLEGEATPGDTAEAREVATMGCALEGAQREGLERRLDLQWTMELETERDRLIAQLAQLELHHTQQLEKEVLRRETAEAELATMRSAIEWAQEAAKEAAQVGRDTWALDINVEEKRVEQLCGQGSATVQDLKRRKLLEETQRNMLVEVRRALAGTGFEEVGVRRFKDEVGSALSMLGDMHNAELGNEDEHIKVVFLKAIAAVLDAKQASMVQEKIAVSMVQERIATAGSSGYGMHRAPSSIQDSRTDTCYRVEESVAEQLRAQGIALDELRKSGLSAMELRTGGFLAEELRSAGFVVQELRDAGFAADELWDCGYSAAELRSGGYTVQELRSAGFSAKQLKMWAVGVSVAEMRDGGYTAGELRKAKFSAKQLRLGGFTPVELKLAGFSARGFSVADRRDGGFAGDELQKAGFTASQLHQGGFQAEELRALGFTLKELQLSGVTVEELRAAGYPVWELQSGDFSQQKPRPIGFRADQQQGIKPSTNTPESEHSIAVLFPGQGTQRVGMAAWLLKSSTGRSLFDMASNLLGYSLADLCTQGPQEKLDAPLFSQTAIYVCSLVAIEVAKREIPELLQHVKTAAGFDLGEYSALAFGGAFSFEDGLKLVKARADAIYAAARSQSVRGGMAFISGITDDILQSCLDQAAEACESGRAFIASYIFHKGRTCSGDLEVTPRN